LGLSTAAPEATDGVPDLVGTTIAGKYLVKRCIGVGGMGSVWEGEHLEIGKRVAIKVIAPEHGQSEPITARFRREARAASAVESEHIVQVFDVGVDAAAGLYMVMEFLAGEDLSTYLERQGGKLPLEEGAMIVAQAARGLAKAHAAGVVHRDLKPANLILTKREDGSTCVKVVDFGISKLQRPEGEAVSQTLTREGSVVGTPIYMSPEQAQGLVVDARTDVWALGALAYEILAGRPPYELLPTYEQMIIQVVTKPVPPLAETAPWVPPDVALVIEAALKHDVAARTQDAASFGRSLAETAELAPFPLSTPRLHLPPPDSAPSIATAATTPGPPTGVGVVVHTATDIPGLPPKRRGRAVAMILGLLVLAGIGAGAVLFATGRLGPRPAPAGLVPASDSHAAAHVEASAQPLPVPSAEASGVATLPSVAAAETGLAASASASSSASAPRPLAGPPAGRRPAARPAGTPAAPPGPTRAGQYGAAGVSTSY
jgi:serine/threonine-protein kinase